MPRKPPPKEPTLREYFRERNKVLRQREREVLRQRQSKPLNAEAAEKLELLRLLGRNELTSPQRHYLVNALLGFWFPKWSAARERRFDRQEHADALAFMIRMARAKTASVADAKRETLSKTGSQSIEAMEQRMKRARQDARRGGGQKTSKKLTRYDR